MSWSPQQYLKFASERLRPAADLLARVPLPAPRIVVDLGCGAGNVTALLRERWPAAQLIGVDSSTEMLQRARAALPDVTFVQGDIASFAPTAPVDLVFSNAALQWLDDHATLFPRLLDQLAPGGVLAVQMPAQRDAPSHRIGYALAGDPRWRERLAPLMRADAVLAPAVYHDLLRPRVRALDLWSTEYLQALAGDHPVAEFTKGSFVGAWLAALDPTSAGAFETEYRAAVARAYPRRDDGVTLFPFRRMFLVART